MSGIMVLSSIVMEVVKYSLNNSDIVEGYLRTTTIVMCELVRDY